MGWLNLHHLIDWLQLFHFNDFSSPIPIPHHPSLAVFREFLDQYQHSHNQPHDQHGSNDELSESDDPANPPACSEPQLDSSMVSTTSSASSTAASGTSSSPDDFSAIVSTSQLALHLSALPSPSADDMQVAAEILSLAQYIVNTDYFQSLSHQQISDAHMHRIMFLIEDCR
jgi:hypothetical protein